MTYVFHGSPLRCFEVVEPRRNIRSEEVGEQRQVLFDDLSFHATPLRWIALAYMYHPTDGYSMGVNLYENNHEVAIFGSISLEHSLGVLYGKGGYLYIFETSAFLHVEGLGTLEVITQEKVRPIDIQWIPDPVQALRDEGVAFRFIVEQKAERP